MNKRFKTIAKFIILLAILGGAIYLFRYSPIADQLTPANIRDFVMSFGIAGFLVFITLYALGAALAMPGTVLTFVGAIIYGTWLGTLLNLLGATLGASIAFFGASYLGRDFVETLMKGKFDQFKKNVEKNGFSVILLLRLVPLFPFIGINYASGLTRIKFKDYFFATLLGMIPGAFVYTYLFATLGETILTEGFQFTDLLTIDVLLPVALFIILIVASTWYKRTRR